MRDDESRQVMARRTRTVNVRPAKPAPRRRGARGHIQKNLANWQRQSNWYDRRHASVLGGRKAKSWGFWRVPESKLHLLGEPEGKDILELGCGAARWSIALAADGARAVGLDLSSAQLAHARRLVRTSGQRVRLVRGNAEQLPFAPESFDIVFCDFGAMTFCDPLRTVPEAARVLRSGGRLVFATSSPIRTLAEHQNGYRIGRRLLYDYFGMHRIEYKKEVNFQLPYGDWIRLFAENRFLVESLTEHQPTAAEKSSYLTKTGEEWARHWPMESIWQVRKIGR